MRTALYTSAHTKAEESSEKKLVIAASSDKGLCGGIHGAISRKIKGIAAANANIDILVIGDKSKAQLARYFNYFYLACGC